MIFLSWLLNLGWLYTLFTAINQHVPDTAWQLPIMQLAFGGFLLVELLLTFALFVARWE